MEFKIDRIVLNAFSRLEMTLAETLVGLQIENVLKMPLKLSWWKQLDVLTRINWWKRILGDG